MSPEEEKELVKELFTNIRNGKVKFFKDKTKHIVECLEKVRFDNNGNPIMDSVSREIVFLAKTLRWIKTDMKKYNFDNENDYIKACVELMNSLLETLHSIIAYTIKSKRYNKGLERNDAIIAGLMVRVTKLFEACLDTIIKKKMELTHIFFRCLMETSINLNY